MFIWLPFFLIFSLNAFSQAGSFIVNTSATARFFQIYFYGSSDGSGAPLPNGVVSFIDNNDGMSLSSGHTYTLQMNSIYQLADSRGLTLGDIHSIKLYMDSGNENPWQGMTGWATFDEDCNTGICTTNTNTQTMTWGAPDTTTVTRYIYIAENGTTLPIYRCPIAVDGTLTCTQQTNGSGTNYSLGTFINNGYLYQAQSSPTNIVRCTLDPSVTTADAITSCSPLTVSDLSAPKGIAFSSSAAGGAYAYVVNGSSSTGSITPCKVNADGTLTCSTTVSTGSNDPRGIVIYQGNVFITNSQDNTISKCSVSGTSITSCGTLTISGPTLKRPRGITVYNGYIYFINDGAVSSGAVVESCDLSSLSGSSITCVDATSGQNSTFGTSGPNGIVIYNGNAYITDFTKKEIFMCSVSTGILGTCSATATGTTFHGPVGIAVY